MKKILVRDVLITINVSDVCVFSLSNVRSPGQVLSRFQKFGYPRMLYPHFPNIHRIYRERESYGRWLLAFVLAIAPVAWWPITNAVAPNEGATRERYHVLPK